MRVYVKSGMYKFLILFVVRLGAIYVGYLSLIPFHLVSLQFIAIPFVRSFNTYNPNAKRDNEGMRKQNR